MNAEEKKARVMPKGGRKGGSIFPRVSLNDALGYAKKLVVKTHANRISQDVVLSGVVGAKSGIGNIRMSALKQYGLIVGDKKALFTASDLAKKIAAAPAEEAVALYRQCVLKPTIFKGLSETFHGDAVSRAKLRQRAAELKVHPEETETCVDVYVSSMALAELVTVDGEQVTHVLPTSAPTPAPTEVKAEDGEQDGQDASDEIDGEDAAEEVEAEDPALPSPRGRAVKAVVTVNVTLDSTTDSDKLAKQLALLRKYGAL